MHSTNARTLTHASTHTHPHDWRKEAEEGGNLGIMASSVLKVMAPPVREDR